MWAAVAVGSSAAAQALTAQVVRGTVRVQDSRRVLAGVHVAAADSSGAVLADVVSDEGGRFTLSFASDGTFQIVLRRVGWRPSFSAFIRASAADTLEVDLRADPDAVELPVVRVEDERSKTPNERAYDDAVRHGWTVYAPEKVAEQRGRYRDFEDLLRGLQVSGIRIGRPGECIQATRYVNRCLAFVVDDVPMGPVAQVQPSDVYFIAVVSAADASVRWGNRAPWGAIVVYTRMYGDRPKR